MIRAISAPHHYVHTYDEHLVEVVAFVQHVIFVLLHGGTFRWGDSDGVVVVMVVMGVIVVVVVVVGVIVVVVVMIYHGIDYIYNNSD